MKLFVIATGREILQLPPGRIRTKIHGWRVPLLVAVLPSELVGMYSGCLSVRVVMGLSVVVVVPKPFRF